jgi:dihydrofolate synthase/folylpolyglutamate synthase
VHYNQAIHFLYTQYPAFERQGGLAYKPGLDNVLSISAAFGDPHKAFKSIHVAGTNGKGSSSSMLAAILQSAGYKVGLYTSPHIHDFTERIRVNGEPIPQIEVVDFVENNTGIFDQFKPSFFEITTILAFRWFAKQQVDIAIIETGMGGRLDATNIIHPEVSLITNVSLDHTQFLGNSIQEIAVEKAGIIKHQVPIVISELQESLMPIYEIKANELHAPLLKAYEYYYCDTVIQGNNKNSLDIVRLDTHYTFKLETDLQGTYQIKNVIGVLSVIDVLKSIGWNITDRSIQEGLAHVQILTGFKGRWQIISQQPLIVLDAAHNEAGMEFSMKQLKALNKNIHIIMGMVKDKDITQVLSLLPVQATYYFCQADSPRAMPAEEIQQLALQSGIHGAVIPDVTIALATARNNAGTDDVIWVGGSLYVLGELVLNK